ncbi:hypothetical protein SAMN02910406_03152 [Ruminococcus albus]|uniref:Uncharacterized protein n=1 Tax=Ruminococcus albus TaxID=1264 RepID=A0A1I1PQ97_RUMAL|nr:hypothetical protein SAMN02910406_03152 [Ruminococcus albus]
MFLVVFLFFSKYHITLFIPKILGGVFFYVVILSFLPILLIINSNNVKFKVSVAILFALYLIYLIFGNGFVSTHILGKVTDIKKYYSPESKTEIVVQTHFRPSGYMLLVYKKENFYYKRIKPNNLDHDIHMQRKEDDDTESLDGKVIWVDDDTFIIKYYNLEDSYRYETKEYIFEI